jgi:hypothetical protein
MTTVWEEHKADLNDLAARMQVLIADELGKFSNGKPAIWWGSVIPATISTTGLQCVIEPMSAFDAKPVSGQLVVMTRVWTVMLTNFKFDENLVKARLKIESAFTMERKSIYLPATSKTYEQCRLSIQDYTALQQIN